MLVSKTPMQLLLENEEISYNFTKRNIENLLTKNKSHTNKEDVKETVGEIQLSLDRGYGWSCSFPVGDDYRIHHALFCTQYFLDDGYIIKIEEECSKRPRVEGVNMVFINIRPNPLHNLVKLIMKSEHKIITVTECRKLAGDSKIYHEKFAKALQMTPFSKKELRNDEIKGHGYFIGKPSEIDRWTYNGKRYAIDRWVDEQNKVAKQTYINEIKTLKIEWSDDIHYAVGDLVYKPHEISFAVCIKAPPRGLKENNSKYWKRILDH